MVWGKGKDGERGNNGEAPASKPSQMDHCLGILPNPGNNSANSDTLVWRPQPYIVLFSHLTPRTGKADASRLLAVPLRRQKVLESHRGQRATPLPQTDAEQ